MKNLQVHTGNNLVMAFDNEKQLNLSKHAQLKNIKVVYENRNVNLQWKAISNGQDFVFIVERSEDGKMFEIIGIKGGGLKISDNEILCIHIDERPSSKYPYYRIIYVEKSNVIFSKLCKIENFESMVMERTVRPIE